MPNLRTELIRAGCALIAFYDALRLPDTAREAARLVGRIAEASEAELAGEFGQTMAALWVSQAHAMPCEGEA